MFSPLYKYGEMKKKKKNGTSDYGVTNKYFSRHSSFHRNITL